MSIVARILNKHRRAFQALAWEQHVNDALDIFDEDDVYEAPEFAPPSLTVLDRLFLRENGVQP